MYKYVLLAMGAFAPFAFAQDFCITLDDQWYYDHTIETSADVTKYTQCSRIGGNMILTREYAGMFELPGLTDIDGFEAGSPGGSHSAPNQGPASVTEISLPELTTAGYFSITNAVRLETILLPKLKLAGGKGGSRGLSIHLTAARTLSLPSLEKVEGYVQFEGEFDVLELPRLKTVSRMYVKTSGTLDCVAFYAQLKDVLILTEPYYEFSPPFQCESSVNSAKSPPPSESVTTASASATSSPTSSSKMSSIASVSSLSSSTSAHVQATSSTSTHVTTSSAYRGTTSSLTTVSTSTSTSTLVAQNGGNGTVTYLSTTRSPGPTARPTGLETSDTVALMVRKWECFGLISIFSAGLLLL